jgi:hypothetical protein
VQGTRWEFEKTYVYHESIRAILSISIPLAYCSRRTILQSHCVGLSERSCGLSTGRGERASVEPLVVAGHLQDAVGLGNEMLKWSEMTNVLLDLHRWPFVLWLALLPFPLMGSN